MEAWDILTTQQLCFVVLQPWMVVLQTHPKWRQPTFSEGQQCDLDLYHCGKSLWSGSWTADQSTPTWPRSTEVFSHHLQSGSLGPISAVLATAKGLESACIYAWMCFVSCDLFISLFICLTKQRIVWIVPNVSFHSQTIQMLLKLKQISGSEVLVLRTEVISCCFNNIY